MNADAELQGPFGEVLQQLSRWAVEMQLIEKAMVGPAGWFLKEAENGLIGGWRLEELQPQFGYHKLCFAGHLSYSYIETKLVLFGPSGYEVGWYSLITLLNGEVDDDYFVVTMTKSEHNELRLAQ